MRWWEGLGTRESERPLPRPAAGLPPAADTAAYRNATNLLTATPDEAAILVAASLGSAADLLRLAVACRRFALKCIAAPRAPRGASSSGAAAAAAQQLEMWSIVVRSADAKFVTCF